MLKKKILASLSAIVLGLIVFSSSAFASTLVVDNDCTSSAPGYNALSSSHWAYGTGSGYNNDYRMISDSYLGSLSNDYYGWIYNVSNKTTGHYVYLANINFNNPSVAYQLDFSSTIVKVNQNTAPSGWTYLGSHTSNSDGTSIYIDGAESSSTAGHAGADATEITY